MENIKRCKWCNGKNPLYVRYHDLEWGVLNLNDAYLFEMLLLESFQAGLSWECVLNKREAFKEAFDQFDYHKIANYDEAKLIELANNSNIIRNKRKIKACTQNAKIFEVIISEYGSFAIYLKQFYDGNISYEVGKVTSSFSDAISKDLSKRGMHFVGSLTMYAFLQAIGLIVSHEPNCFLYLNK